MVIPRRTILYEIIYFYIVKHIKLVFYFEPDSMYIFVSSFLNWPHFCMQALHRAMFNEMNFYSYFKFSFVINSNTSIESKFSCGLFVYNEKMCSITKKILSKLSLSSYLHSGEILLEWRHSLLFAPLCSYSLLLTLTHYDKMMYF